MKIRHHISSGDRFGDIEVLQELSRGSYRQRMLECRCYCGTVFIADFNNLRSGSTSSCGCLRKAHPNRLTHNGSQTSEYHTYHCMKQRCLNSNHPRYEDWGGRGILICECWLGRNGFANFIEDMGLKPSKQHSLDRFPDPDGPYSPDNCRWATATQQANNKRANQHVTYLEKRLTITELCARIKMGHSTLSHRLQKQGMTLLEAIGPVTAYLAFTEAS